jgi:hypothetical protein
MIDKLITFFLDYLNSGVSINDFAAKHEISRSECLVLLAAGNRLYALSIENSINPIK